MNGIDCASTKARCLQRCFTDHPSRMVILELDAPGTRGGLGFSIDLTSKHPNAQRRIAGSNVLFHEGLSLLSCRTRLGIVGRNNALITSDGGLYIGTTGSILVLLATTAGCSLSSTACIKRASKRLRGHLASQLTQTSTGNCSRLGSARLGSCRSLFGHIQFSLGATTGAKKGVKVGARVPSIPAGRLMHLRGRTLCLSVLCFRCKQCLVVTSSHKVGLPGGLRKV